MKVLLSWLREFAPFEGDPVALGDEMSDLGMAVESIDYLGAGLDGIVVARVLELRPHPNAERIQLVDVDLGDGEALQICCGAFNMAVGDLVPLATLGTVMPGGMKIEKRKLRGEVSNGMLCSISELGLADGSAEDEAGIKILGSGVESGLVPGTAIKEALGIEADVLYDLEINPNRPDAMSVAGVARDLAARQGIPFAVPVPKVPVPGVTGGGESPDTAGAGAGIAAGDLVSVDIVDGDLCGRFHVRVLRDVPSGSSPAWLANRLTALGMRPINRVVDVSNYVMLELGQPNHTFDLAKVAGAKLGVRWARDGETVTTLDGDEQVLVAGDGVVVDGDDEVISIAGVMGGASTEIDETTTDVLLEMAWWKPMAIARTSARLGLRSEASMRFERGSDPDIIDLAADRFVELLLTDTEPGPAGSERATSGSGVHGSEPAGARVRGSVARGAVDVRGSLRSSPTIEVRTARLNGLLGTDLSDEDIRDLLRPIGFGCEAGETTGTQSVTVPSFRPDITTETDVAEEVARHFGYSKIRPTTPTVTRMGRLTPKQADRRLVRQVLVGLGVDEALPNPFLAPEDLARTGSPERAVVLTNPMAAEESVLRTSLRAGLLGVVAHNASHRNPGVRVFEVGKVFLPSDDAVLPDEPEQLAVALAGAEAPAAVAALLALTDALVVDDVVIDQRPVPGLHPTRSGEIAVGGDTIGAVGEIDPAVLETYDIAERVAWFELDLDRLLAAAHADRPYRHVSRYPSSDIDLAFEVDETTPAQAVESTIRDAGGALVVSMGLFDVFRGAALPAGTRSLAYGLRLQAPDRTLTDDEVATVRAAVIAAVEAAHPAKLRT